MPLYEFYCKRCNQWWTELLKASEDKTPCINCKRETKKVISLPSKPVIK